MAAYDPIVARALDRLVPGVESDPDAILHRAIVAAEGLKRRRAARLRRTAVLAFALLALLAGVSVAASRFDPFSWLDQSSRSSASYSIDSSRTYRGPAPGALLCPEAEAGAGSFTCTLGTYPATTRRTYYGGGRVEAPKGASREDALEELAAGERRGEVDHATAERFRRDLAAVDDDFFSGLAPLAGFETIGGAAEATGRPGFERVPPARVPMWIACEASGESFRCHDLASSRNIAVGTPLYALEPSADWVEVPRQSPQPVNLRRLFHALLGRELTPAEERLLFDFVNWPAGEPHSRPVQAEPVPPPKRQGP